MRAAVLTLTIVAALFLAHSHAWAFDCFETPEGKRRGACIGAKDCSEMRQSGGCKSDPECDHGELGAVVCSCTAVRTPRARLRSGAQRLKHPFVAEPAALGSG